MKRHALLLALGFVALPAGAQQVQLQFPDIAGAVQRGYAAGQEQRLREIQIQQAQAQLEQQQQDLRDQQEASKRPITYQCPADDGTWVTTYLPSPGCVVASR